MKKPGRIFIVGSGIIAPALLFAIGAKMIFKKDCIFNNPQTLIAMGVGAIIGGIVSVKLIKNVPTFKI